MTLAGDDRASAFASLMNPTPYETKLRSVAAEAAATGDRVDANLIAHMIMHIQSARYEDAQGIFAHLRPIYRSRLGPPPASREKDVEPKPRPNSRGA